MDILRTIFIILIVYYSVRFISSLLVPLVLRTFVKRAQRNFQQQFRRQQPKPQAEGEVSIDSKPKNKSNSSGTSFGEYVDFEEVDD